VTLTCIVGVGRSAATVQRASEDPKVRNASIEDQDLSVWRRMLRSLDSIVEDSRWLRSNWPRTKRDLNYETATITGRIRRRQTLPVLP
jgi:hypothetical protein